MFERFTFATNAFALLGNAKTPLFGAAAAGLFALSATVALAADPLPDGRHLDAEFDQIQAGMDNCDSDQNTLLDQDEFEGCPNKPAPFDSAAFGSVDANNDGSTDRNELGGFYLDNK